MRRRIKHYLQEDQISIDPQEPIDDKEQIYLQMLVEDLKKESEMMPAYSLWHEIVQKCLSDKPHDN